MLYFNSSFSEREVFHPHGQDFVWKMLWEPRWMNLCLQNWPQRICFIIQDGNNNVKLTINNALYYMDGQGC